MGRVRAKWSLPKGWSTGLKDQVPLLCTCKVMHGVAVRYNFQLIVNSRLEAGELIRNVQL